MRKYPYSGVKHLDKYKLQQSVEHNKYFYILSIVMLQQAGEDNIGLRSNRVNLKNKIKMK